MLDLFGLVAVPVINHTHSFFFLLESHHEETNKVHNYAKTKTQISFAVTMKLISVHVFATGMVQLFF